MQIKILIVTPALNASSVIGITKPLIELEKRGLVSLRLRYGSISFGWKKDCDWCDIAVFNRAQGFKDLMLLYYLKRMGKKVIYDIDDNFLEIPVSLRVGQAHRLYPKIHGVTQFYKLSDITRVYTKRMADQVVRYGGNPDFIKCYFDTNLLNGLTPEQDTKIKIAFATARIDDPQLDRMMSDSLCHISDKYGDQIEIHLWRKPSNALRQKSNVIIHTPTYNYDEFIKKFYQIGFDIGLAPVMEHPFYQSKSNNKYREYGGMNIAGIYSNLSPYADSIDHLTSGYLADNNADAWIKGISYLIDNADARRIIYQNARADIEKNYSFDTNISTWYEQIKTLSSQKFTPVDHLPYLENISSFLLKILVPSYDVKNSHFGNATPQIQVLSEIGAHLNIKYQFNTIQNFFFGGKYYSHKRYYVLPQDLNDLTMLEPMANQKNYAMIDLTLLPLDLNQDYIDAIQKLVDQNKDHFLFIGTKQQLDHIHSEHKYIIKDDQSSITAMDKFSEDYIGLPRYRALEWMMYNQPYSRMDKIKSVISFVSEKYDLASQIIFRRLGQLIGLISWRLGRRT